MKRLTFFLFLAVLAVAGVVPAVMAQSQSGVAILSSDGDGTVRSYLAEDNTHPDIRLTPDKSALLRLPSEVSTVIVGNPVHLSVLAESSTMLVLVGKVPGATHFSALDEDGNVIMQRHVIVASPKEGYLRVRRSCAGASVGGESSSAADCLPTSMYYCPDMCHEMALSTGEEESASGSAVSDGGTPPAGEE